MPWIKIVVNCGYCHNPIEPDEQGVYHECACKQENIWIGTLVQEQNWQPFHIFAVYPDGSTYPMEHGMDVSNWPVQHTVNMTHHDRFYNPPQSPNEEEDKTS